MSRSWQAAVWDRNCAQSIIISRALVAAEQALGVGGVSSASLGIQTGHKTTHGKPKAQDIPKEFKNYTTVAPTW